MQTLAETLPCRPRGGILPPQLEYCDSDGSLRMGFAPVLDVQLRLSSWSDGLELQRWEPEGWTREDEDPQLLQVASVEGLPPEHALRRFAASLPD